MTSLSLAPGLMNGSVVGGTGSPSTSRQLSALVMARKEIHCWPSPNLHAWFTLRIAPTSSKVWPCPNNGVELTGADVSVFVRLGFMLLLWYRSAPAAHPERYASGKIGRASCRERV